MPQKKNPAALEHIKAVAGMVGGAFTATSACVKNTSLSDVADGVTALNEPALDACQRARNILLLLDEVLAPLDREEFTRQVDYYGDLYGEE